MGVPSFLMGAYLILWSMVPIIPSLMSLSSVDMGLFINLMQMLFGYTVATSFYKSQGGEKS